MRGGAISSALGRSGVYRLGTGDGDARFVLGEVDTIKATALQTGGLFGLKESVTKRGLGPPLHVHEREDEACFVLEGQITVFAGNEVIPAPAGTWVYLPRGIPHSERTDSDEAKALWLIVPGGFESFFVETFPPATDDGQPAGEEPTVEQMVVAAERYGVTVLGPAPGTDPHDGGGSK